MATFRATHKTTGEVVNYDAETPQAEHLADPWRLESIEVSFIAPPDPDTHAPAYAGSWRITKRSFWNRLPEYNEVAMRAVMLAGTPAVLAASLSRLQGRIDASPFVDLQLAETVGGVNWLASGAVPATVDIEGTTLPLRLSAEQAAAILETPPTDAELFNG